MLGQIMQYLNNWFDTERHTGLFTVEGGKITLPFLLPGQFYRVVGSAFNDGVYKYGERLAKDETFDGAIWALRVPRDFLDLASEIESWQQKNGEACASPYQSESFGGYSYTKGSSSSGDVSWQTAFKSRLNSWRKIRC